MSDAELVPRIKAFADDFASAPWRYIFEVNTEMQATLLTFLGYSAGEGDERVRG
jgi:hypothetical protein